VFTAQKEVDGYARFVPMPEIKANEFNLNIPRYIDATEDEDIHDLEAHLKGGIPKADLDDLESYWTVFPNLRSDLFSPARPGYSHAQVPAREVKPFILDHADFKAFAATVQERTQAWREEHELAMRALSVGANPKAFIEELSEDLLDRFAGVPLVNRYAVYQRLMDFWQETMQDDVYILAQDGWEAGRTIRTAFDGEDPDFTIGRGKSKKEYVGELIPPSLIIDRFFPEEQAEIEKEQGRLDEAQQELDEFEEAHTGEGEALDGLEGSRGVTKGNVQDRVQELKNEAKEVFEKGSSFYTQANSITKTNFGTREWTKGVDDPEGIFAELDVLYDYLSRYEDVTTKKSDVKEAREELHRAVLEKYPDLTDEEVKNLVVEDKWIATVEDAVRDEVERITQQLSGRVQDLETRYADPLPELEDEVDALAETVKAHLQHVVGGGVEA